MTRMTRRDFARLGGASAVALNAGVLFSADVAAAPVRGSQVAQPVKVNPELAGVVPALEQMMRRGSLTMATLPAAREAWPPAAPLPKPSWSSRVIPGSNGAPGVRIYIINSAAGDQLRPAILHTHGGGFVLGRAKDAIRPLQQQAQELDCVIVTVDYRLAPEVRFPGSLEDNYAALKWLYANAAELGVDRSKIALMGESAGGGHAAMLAIAARDRGEIPIIYQALIYPMLDDRTGSTVKVPPFIGTLIWNAEDNRFGWTALLGEPAGSRRVPYGSVPARVADLAGLAPAFIGVGSIDLFVGEDVEYAHRLMYADVPTELRVVPGAFHGFNEIVPNAPVSRQFNAALNNALARAFRQTATPSQPAKG